MNNPSIEKANFGYAAESVRNNNKLLNKMQTHLRQKERHPCSDSDTEEENGQGWGNIENNRN